MYLIILSILILPISANAVYEVIDARCTDDIKVSLRKEGLNVSYKLEKVVNKNIVSYNITLLGMTDNIYINTSFDKIKYIKGDVIKNITPGSSIILTIYASNSNYCEGYMVTSKVVQVPYYNKYSTNPLCKGHEDYSLCKETENVNITEKEFETRMKLYIDSIKEEELKKPEEEKKEVENSSFDFIGFISDYSFYIAGALGVVLMIILIISINNKNKKRGIL